MLERNHDSIFEMAFAGAVRALKASSLTELLQALAADKVAAGQHHGWVIVGSLDLLDGTDKDGVVDHRPWKRRLKRQLVLLRPFCLLALERCCELDQPW